MRVVLVVVAFLAAVSLAGQGTGSEQPGRVFRLPEPKRDGGVTVEAALARRRSVRSFAPRALALAEISRLLWAAQGVTHEGFKRTAPSAGALYPLEVYLVVGSVFGLEPGVYLYRARRHDLVLVAPGDVRTALGDAAVGQSWLAAAPAVVLLCAVVDRTTAKYGERGHRYVAMEVGAAAENLALEAVALGLGTTPVGAFGDEALRRAARLPGGEEPLLLLPVGTPAR